ncbi:MAG TPA: T9SS type A sorting domain-containing protein, partial [Membranihabitans sp.]|nr:T9SS type A sorting domain-containing protein [Membranihabitans sp.]
SFDLPSLDLEIIDEFWADMSLMDTLFRVWEVRSNNGKGVVTCTDTIVREAIPLASVIFPADDTVFCESWDGTSPDPSLSGRPYIIDEESGDTTYLDAGGFTHCATISYTDEAWGRLDCELEKYLRYWKIRTAEGVLLDTQAITVIDTLGPVGQFQFAAADSLETIVDGDTFNVPVFRISTGSHGCESDGNLPVLYATDGCSGVHSVSATTTDEDGIVHKLTNGGPFMGFSEGKYLVTYTAADSCWNMSNYYVWVEVTDHVNPVILLGDVYNITMSGEVTWLDLREFVKHHVTDNCGLELVVGRRVGDHATSCGADDSTSIVGMYRDKYRMWLENDGWDCTGLVDVDSGWLDKIPFCCADLGSEVMIEIMAIDQSCNVSRGMTFVVPIDKGGATIYERLPDISLACSAWSEHYQDLIINDTATNGLNLDSLDKYFGTYQPFVPGSTPELNPIQIEDHTCYVADGIMVTEEILQETHDGLYQASCAGVLTQEAELVYDEGCNTFTIVRHFLINGSEIAIQRISTEIRCPFVEEAFEYPANHDTMVTIADIGILRDPAYWTGNRFNLETEGPVYAGSDCRVIAIGYVDKLMDMISSSNPNEADAVIVRTWCMADWCSSDLGPDWKSSIGNDGILMWVQNIKIFVDPDNPDVAIAKTDPNGNEVVTNNPPTTKSVFDVKGQIRTEDALNVNNVTVEWKTTDQSEEMVTNESGTFEIKVNEGSRVKITPVKKGGLGNGLSTLDLILIQRHLLRKQLITSPYKLIAADANNDRKLTPADVLFLRRVILNKMDGLAEASSWKFIDAKYSFINQKAAYSEDYPTELDIEHISKDLTSEFIAVKLGDVNHSANVSRSSSRTSHPYMALEVKNQTVTRGEIVEVPILMTESIKMAGVQFALQADTRSVEVLEVRSGNVTLDQDQWTLEDGLIRLSWSDIESHDMAPGDQLITVKLRANRDVALQDALSLNQEVIIPEVYDQADQIRNLGLTFVENDESVFAVYQNRPNPVQGETIIEYNAGRNAEVRLQIHDVTGKLIYTDEADVNRGVNQFRVHTNQLQAGVLYYTITDGKHSATRKMVVIR